MSTALRWGALHGDSLQHTLTGIRDNSDKVFIINTYQAMTSGAITVLHSAGAPYMGTVCHTHSLRSGTTLTRFVLYQAMTPGTVTVLVTHSAGAPYMGTVYHTHSVRSGTTLTRLIYQAMTSGTVTVLHSAWAPYMGTIYNTHTP